MVMGITLGHKYRWHATTDLIPPHSVLSVPKVLTHFQEMPRSVVDMWNMQQGAPNIRVCREAENGDYNRKMLQGTA